MLPPYAGPNPPEDARWLVARAPVTTARRVLDAGCGAGIVALLALRRWPNALAVGVEVDAALAALAVQNARAWGCDARMTVQCVRVEEMVEGDFDVVLSNPPYHLAERGHGSPNVGVARAFMTDREALQVWLNACGRCVAPGGLLGMVMPPVTVATLDWIGWDVVVEPLQTHRERPAKRMLVWARQGKTRRHEKDPLRGWEVDVRAARDAALGIGI